MAVDFKYLKFGLVPVSLNRQLQESSEQVFNSFLSASAGYGLIENAEAHKEVFKTAINYFGTDFRSWLIANFRNGNGGRRELVRKIVLYINGKISGRILLGQVKIDLNRIEVPGKYPQPVETFIYNEYDDQSLGYVIEDVSFYNITNDHMFDVFAAIGPEYIAKLCLSLDGVEYD